MKMIMMKMMMNDIVALASHKFKRLLFRVGEGMIKALKHESNDVMKCYK